MLRNKYEQIKNTKRVTILDRALSSITQLRIVSTRVDARLKAKSYKGRWRMPRLLEATKDVISCEKLRGLAHTN